MFNSAKKVIYSACIILLFGVIIPAWIASVKVETIRNVSPSPLADPVMKVIGNTRKFLLGRIEGDQIRDKIALWNKRTGIVSPLVTDEN